MSGLLILANKAYIQRHLKHTGWPRHETHFAAFAPVDLIFIQEMLRVRLCIP
jgi:hypothetical protein